MKFSARSQYAIEAMLALVPSHDGAPIQVRHISRDHNIPVRFLEQIMAALKKAELVRSVRGARGGYLLCEAPKNIHVAQILLAVEGPIHESRGIPTEAPATRVVHNLWGEAQAAVENLFTAITLDTLAKRKEQLEGERTLMYHI